MAQENDYQFSKEERTLLGIIAEHIQTNPNDYKQAGEWIDEYCSESAYWSRKKDELERLKKSHGTLPEDLYKRDVDRLEKEIAEKRTPPLIIRFNEAQKYFSDKYKDLELIPKDEAKKIILITWLITDPDAENTKLNITEFENWIWEPLDDISKLSRGFKGFLFSQNKDSWMRLINIAWGKIDTATQDVKSEVKKAHDRFWQSGTFKFVVIPLIGFIVMIVMGIPAWLSLRDKTDHGSIANADIFAYVSKDGTILRSKNFPWTINKSKDNEGNVIYIIEGRHGDSSAVSVTSDDPKNKYTLYKAIAGVAVKFTCPEDEISNFTIKVKY